MTRRHQVKGTNPAAIWLSIVLFLILAVAITVIVFLIAPAQQLERQTQATTIARLTALEQHYAAGVAYADAGDWPAAADAFRQVIAQDAGYKDAQAQLSQASAQVTAQAAQAEENATATVQAGATATAQALAALYARGQGLMNLGRWAEAAVALQAVFDVDPNYEDVQRLLVTTSAKQTPTPTPTPTPAPPTPTPLPPTPTPAPPSPTHVPPTPTPTRMPPTPTRAPPSRTPTAVPPTPTPLSPTHTPTADQPAAGAVRTFGDVPFVYVPAGEFLMGPADALETAHLDAYWIGQTEVTNAQFRAFVDAGGYTTARYWSAGGWQWRSDNSRTGPGCWEDADFNAADQPVICVTWYEAEAYANWLAEFSGEPVRLPTQAEWEKAARGADGRIYPWGDDFDGTRLNYCDVNCSYGGDASYDDGVGDRTAPVGSYPAGASPFGALDMAGNVWEWTIDPSDAAPGAFWLKGGSWADSSEYTQASAAGNWGLDWVRVGYLGFRVVCVPVSHG